MLGRHGAIVGYRGYGFGSGLASVLIDIDGQGPEVIHGDYRPISNMSHSLPPGSRVVVLDAPSAFDGPIIVPEDEYTEEWNN